MDQDAELLARAGAADSKEERFCFYSQCIAHSRQAFPERSLREQCTICLERIAQSIRLPCACRLAYCPKCWDRALAKSFATSGWARCPTCRAAVRVDLDMQSGALVFSQEKEEPLQDVVTSEEAGLDETLRAIQQEQAAVATEDYFQRTTARIQSQVRPLQIRILEQYGAKYPVPLSFPPEVSRAAVPGVALALATKAARRVQRQIAEGKQDVPRCVCGCRLRRIAVVERARSWVRKNQMAPEGALDASCFELEVVEAMHAIFCDICNGCASGMDALWSCKNGSRTIKHATAYDICDACLVRYMRAGSSLRPRPVGPISPE